MDDDQFQQLIEKMDILIKLTALNSLGDKDPKEKVRILSGLGLRPIEIARIIEKTQNYVNVTLHRLRKEEEKQSEESKAESQNQENSK